MKATEATVDAEDDSSNDIEYAWRVNVTPDWDATTRVSLRYGASQNRMPTITECFFDFEGVL